jgi:hypothetical protein
MHRRKSRHVDNDEWDDSTVFWSRLHSYLLTSLAIEPKRPNNMSRTLNDFHCIRDKAEVKP